MEQQKPRRLEENLGNLSRIMAALKEFRDEVALTKAQQMESWLEKVNSIVEEFHVLEKQINELNKGGGWRVNLMEGKPKRYSKANLISFTSNFSKVFAYTPHGVIFKGQFPNGEQVAVQILDFEEEVLEPIFMSEINTVFKTSHRNLIKLHGFCFDKNKKGLVFEYMPKGSLDKVLFENQPESLEWEKLYNIAIETGKGLSYLHDGCDEQLIHCDLSTANVHLDSSYSPKITNFGMVKLMNRCDYYFKMSYSYYAAPELFKGISNVTYKCDVYSFGMILFEILGRRSNNEKAMNYPRNVYWTRFEEGKVEELLTECSIPDKNRNEARILCMVAFWCIQLTPENRPSMSTVVKMLEKEIQVVSPPNPFIAATSPMKSYREVVYEERWFMKIMSGLQTLTVLYLTLYLIYYILRHLIYKILRLSIFMFILGSILILVGLF